MTLSVLSFSFHLPRAESRACFSTSGSCSAEDPAATNRATSPVPLPTPPFLSNPTIARFSFLARDVYASGPQYISRSASTQRSLDTSSICTVPSTILYHELLLPRGCHLRITISICLQMLLRRKPRIYVLRHASLLSSVCCVTMPVVCVGVKPSFQEKGCVLCSFPISPIGLVHKDCPAILTSLIVYLYFPQPPN